MRRFASATSRATSCDIVKLIFLNDSCCIFIQISQKFSRKGKIDNKPSEQATSIISTNDDIGYTCIYASLGHSD